MPLARKANLSDVVAIGARLAGLGLFLGELALRLSHGELL